MKSKRNDIVYMTNINDSLKKKLSKKKVAIVLVAALIVIIIIVLFSTYAMNESFRNRIDEYMIFKHIEENNVPYINIENLNNATIFAWSNCIAVIDGNKITKYDSVGKDIAEINVELTNPITATNGEYAVVSEKNGKKIYLLKRNEILWEKDLEGRISKINVNAHGYVSVIVTGTTYRSVIEIYNDEGAELFKTYLSSTIAVNAEISEDNRYLAFSEVNISGTMIQSDIKIISIEKAKEKSSVVDSIIYTYNADANSLIIDMRYQSRNRLVCIYDNSIHIIENSQDKKIIDLDANNKYNSFADIKLNNFVVVTKEESKDLFNNNTAVNFTNIDNQKSNIYNFKGNIKNLHSYYDKVGINTGKEIHFVGTNGWLVKKYKASGDIKDLVMNNSIAGVIYKNKIEIVNL